MLLNLYLLRLGYGPAVVGLVNGMGFVAYALFSLPAGALGARYGTRRMLQVGFVLAATGMGLLPAAQFLSGNVQVAWIVATYTLTSMGLDAYFVNSNPFMIQFTTPRERMYLYSLRVGMSPIAAFVGALVGGFLPETLARLLPITDTASFALALLVAAVALLIGVVALFNTTAIAAPEEEEDRPERTGSAALDRIASALDNNDGVGHHAAYGRGGGATHLFQRLLGGDTGDAPPRTSACWPRAASLWGDLAPSRLPSSRGVGAWSA